MWARYSAPREMDNVLMKGLSKRKEDRYETMVEFRQELEKIIAKYP